jgi:hypothetical protein
MAFCHVFCSESVTANEAPSIVLAYWSEIATIRWLPFAVGVGSTIGTVLPNTTDPDLFWIRVIPAVVVDGITVSVNDRLVALRVTVSATAVLLETVAAVAVKVVLVAPAAIETDPGTDTTDDPLLATATLIPPAGAASEIVTVQDVDVNAG